MVKLNDYGGNYRYSADEDNTMSSAINGNRVGRFRYHASQVVFLIFHLCASIIITTSSYEWTWIGISNIHVASGCWNVKNSWVNRVVLRWSSPFSLLSPWIGRWERKPTILQRDQFSIFSSVENVSENIKSCALTIQPLKVFRSGAEVLYFSWSIKCSMAKKTKVSKYVRRN